MNIKTRDIILVALFTALMTVGAFVRIPFPYVPLTFQPFFCALAGLILGPKLGTLSQVIYVAAGLAGIPVFTQGSGPLYVLKPSFGYLIGFITAAYVIGKMCEKLNAMKFHNILISLVCGLFAIYLAGVPYSYLISRFYLGNQSTTLWYIAVSSILFFIKDLVLYIIVAAVTYKILPVLRNAGLLGHLAK
ncbi:MAG TPA: biotin transporter BioY [Clostridiaceae bacterium]|nr:biotin transporter BioY [Clostridiaceae bacterium]